MAKATYIKSYAHAEKLGIKPFGSIVSTVVIPAKKPKIVAYAPGHSFMVGDRGKFTLGKMQTWTDRYGYQYHATTKPMLDILLKELFNRKPRLVKVSYGR